MANLIQIKRSLNSASPTSLANGELAYTANGNVLFIGSNGATVAIGGERNPGVLTANQALVANSTSYIDLIKAANAVLTSISANGSYGSAGQVLVSDGANVYWGTGTSGSNTQVQFNDSGVANGAAGFTFDKSTNTLAVGNTLTVNNVFSTTQVNSALLSVGTDFLANSSGVYSTGTVNADTLAVGTSTLANSTGVYTGTVNAASLTVGSDLIANSSGLFTSGQVNADSLTVGSSFVADNSKVEIDANTQLIANGTSGSSGQVLYTTGSGVYWADVTGDILSVAAGDGLTGGGNSGDITINVGSGNGISVDADSVFVNAADGLVANASGLFVLAGTGVTVNATGVHIGQAVETTSDVTFNDLTVNGNTILGSNSSDLVTINAKVGTDVIPSANATYSLGSAGSRWAEIYAGNVVAVAAYYSGNVEVSGDVIIAGNLITTNVQSVIISDPLIYLAGNNTISDIVDIGFAGTYYSGGEQKSTGLFRDATDEKYYLFKDLTQDLTTSVTVNVADPTFALADLSVYLNSGGLITNSTAVSITANSTVAVDITANTLSLSSPLSAVNGGTGYNTYIAGDILTAGNSTSLSVLSLGTDGYVLQSNGSALVYDTLDGGTF